MTEIYLIRHAQAEGNRYRIMQGHWDGGVTDVGRQQIALLAERLKDIQFTAVYSSDLYRARLTAGAALKNCPLPLHTDPALREINVGPWETKFFGNVFYDYPQESALFLHDPANWRIDGAETYADVTARAYPALERIARLHEGGRVAVVSHGVTIRCLLSKITGIALKDTDQLPICRNTAISRLRWEDGHFTVLELNDSAHLEPLGEQIWNRQASLRHEELDPAQDRRFYTGCYSDAWLAAHGNLNGYFADPYFDAACRHHRANPGAVLRILDGDTPAGLVDLDPSRGAHAGYGWLSLLYLRPEYRDQGYGIQLLARAIVFYRALGRRSLRLLVAEDNVRALRFYRREGFTALSQEQGVGGKLLLMEKPLYERRDDL